MCAVHTLPYLSHKMVKNVSFRIFTQIQLYKLYQQCLGFNFDVLEFLSTFLSII